MPRLLLTIEELACRWNTTIEELQALNLPAEVSGQYDPERCGAHFVAELLRLKGQGTA